MKINDVNRLQGLNNYKKLNQQEKSMKSKASKDQVTISNEAKALLEQTKGTRSEKVQQLKEQVSTGTYQVDANEVAEKMLEWNKKLK